LIDEQSANCTPDAIGPTREDRSVSLASCPPP
jgi:hypothetical protein